MPKVIIIILNWNRPRDTSDCLESLKRILYRNYEVVVVDNGSTGNDAQMLEQDFGNLIHVIRNKVNQGFAGGNNVGIRWALGRGCEYVLLLNDDTVVDPEFLSELILVAENDKQAGIVGPKICCYDEPKRIYSAGGRINLWTGSAPSIGRGRIDNGEFDDIEEVDYVSGCALLIRKDTILRIGLLNERYFAYYEETEWCVRARKQGYSVTYVPRAKILHKEKTRESELSLYYMTRNRFLFMKRNASRLKYAFFTLFFLGTDPIRKMEALKLFRKPRMLRAYFKGICDGLRIAPN
ncbi:glycosyltransferase family 2 protein [Candidatus Bathyarchaeota archaeon]|nr:glycosyltransferase family 2 protein [Candidatus Bathyarchaeota archaeon]